MKKVLLMVGLVLGTSITTACKVTEVVRGSTSPADSVVAVTVNPSVLVTTVGQSTQLVAEPRNSVGVAVTKSAVWSSSDVSKATVSTTGVVTALAAGATYIRATVDGVVAQVPVAISEVPVSVILLTPSSTTILVGQTTTPAVSLRGPNNQVLTNRFVSWTSSNTSVASVNALGTITGVTSGTATITVTSEGKTAAFTVVVNMTPVATTVLSSSTPAYVGRTTPLLLTLRDSSGNLLSLSGRNVVWSTNDNTKISVSATGVVTGLSAGAATVVAIVEGKVGILTITVGVLPINNVVITSSTTAPLSVGGTRQFIATAVDLFELPIDTPALAGRSFVWSTETPSKIAVSANGLVTAIASGEAILKVAIDGIVTRVTVFIIN